MSKINFFAREEELPAQDASESYGIVSATQYKVTSLFKGSVPGTDPMAFAVTSGKIFIVDQTGQPDRVNLFLKPEENVAGFPQVKYFVYRGLLKSDFLDKNNSYQTIRPSDANDSDLIKIIRKGLDGIKALDVYSSIPDAGLVDDLFIKEDNQFARISTGDSLGRFDTISSGLNYGFEVMLDEFWYSPAMSIARMDANIIDIPSNADDAEVARLNILAYIDPAAYFGHFSHGDFSIGTNNTSSPLSAKQNDVYQLVSKFTTKNAVYIDIRGVDGHPMDWYTTDPKNIKITQDGSDSSSSNEIPYRAGDNFPLHLITNAFSGVQSNGNQKYFVLNVSLSTVNNTTPLLALHFGYWNSLFPKFDPEIVFSQCTDNSGWTDGKKFIVFAINESGNDVPVSMYIRMHLTEYVDANALANQIPDEDPYDPFVINMKSLFSIPFDAIPNNDDITNTTKPIV